MLYATTRSKNDVYTAHKVIHQDCAGDGGLFLPLSLPKYDMDAIQALQSKSCAQNMADVLNAFFSCGMTAFDIEFAIGRSPIRNVSINNRTVIAEAWHNSHWSFDYIIQAISNRLCREELQSITGNWVHIAVRISALFGIYGMLLSSGQVSVNLPLDIAATAGDFATPIAAWYAREMGLPVGNIVCGCNTNGAVWDLLHRGQLVTSATAVRTCTPESDFVVPRNLERLVHATLGQSEADRYMDCCRTGTTFTVNEETFEQLRSGMFASVISDNRVRSVIVNVYRNSGYVLSPYAALAYGSLSDYRSKTGESRTALLLSERSPVRDDHFVAGCMDISVPELEKILHLA